MSIVVAKDRVRASTGEIQSFSAVWQVRAAELGVDVVAIDPFADDAIDRITGADGFMWRQLAARPFTDAGRQLLAAVELGLDVPCWPGPRERLFFEDKIAQSLFLRSAGVPHPRTWIFWSLREALETIPRLEFPLVAKLASAIQSRGVTLLRSPTEAERLARRMFGTGCRALVNESSRLGRLAGPRLVALKHALLNENTLDTERGYLYLQEFLPGNAFDTRLLMIGSKMMGIVRQNRENDFRASGSGRFGHDPGTIDPRAVELMFRLARELDVQALTVDILFREGEPVIGEFGHTMAVHATRQCPGHWRLEGGEIEWVAGSFDPPTEIFDQFVSGNLTAAQPARSRSARRAAGVAGLTGRST